MYSDYKRYDRDVQFEIGQRIQSLRIEKGISSIEMAELLGICKNQLSRIENGRANCTISQLFVIAQVLNCSVDFIMFGKQACNLSKDQINAIEGIIRAFK